MNAFASLSFFNNLVILFQLIEQVHIESCYADYKNYINIRDEIMANLTPNVKYTIKKITTDDNELIIDFLKQFFYKVSTSSHFLSIGFGLQKLTNFPSQPPLSFSAKIIRLKL